MNCDLYGDALSDEYEENYDIQFVANNKEVRFGNNFTFNDMANVTRIKYEK